MAIDVDTRDAPASLTASILEQEAGKQFGNRQDKREYTVPEDLLPGEGTSMPLRDVLRAGGVSTVGVLSLVNLVDEFDRAAVAVLAPDIQDALGISDTLLGVIATLGGVLIVLGAVPIGYLADRVRRTRVIAAVSAVLGVAMFFTGLVNAAWQLALTRIAAGFGKGGGPAHNAVLADAYPTAGRGRIFAIFNLANPVGVLIGPFLVGACTALAGGDGAWRWAFILLSLPTLVLAAATLFVREPQRGRNEQEAVFGGEALPEADEGAQRIALGTAFARLRRIKTFYFILVGLGILGFGLFSFTIFFNVFLEDHHGLDAFQRGLVTSLSAVGGLGGGVVGGLVADRVARRDPARAVVLTAALLALFVFAPLSMFMPNMPLLVAVNAIGYFGITGAVTGLVAIVALVIPFRMRAQGYALVGIYMFFFGAFFGALLTGRLADAYGERTALALVVPPAALLGAFLMSYGSRHIARDMTMVVDELREERAEFERVRAGGEVPVLQVRNLDFSYGQVQVLFDVSLDVRKGEVVALLGTNGAGKSTLLRAVTGLSMPDKGVIRLNGRTITYSDAEARVGMGIVQVPGGKAVFPTLTVEENLIAGAYTYVWEVDRVRARVEEVLELFPALVPALGQKAGTLSGGQQQMLALAKAMLLDPEILLIDELSLGLAPVVVTELLGIVEQLKAKGVTMVIVEQSVNVALSIADRAVFMEKGEVRFEGQAADLLERDDLVRAVFLSGEGG